MPDFAARKLLYVEDDRINIILMEEACRGLPGWVLQVAEDGRQALEQLANSSLPDAVLIDMNLPDMSGLDLMARIRADKRLDGLRCIAMSADDQQHVVKAALASGFSDFWLKPVNPQRFQTLI